MMEGAQGLPPTLLTQAFSDFILASARLERSYRELQATVAALTLTLAEKDRALSTFRSEKEVIHHLLHGLLQALPCGVLVIDGDGRVCLANSESARLLALSAAQMPSPNAIRQGTGLDLRRPPQTWSASFQCAQEQELCFQSSSGEHRIRVQRIALSSTPREQDGRQARTVFILQEMTSRQLRSSEGPIDVGSCAGLSMEEVERRHLTHTLEHVGGNRTRAAAILRISVRTLSSKIKQYDLPPRRYA